MQGPSSIGIRSGAPGHDPSTMHGNIATSAALATPRLTLPSTRRHPAPTTWFAPSFAKALAIATLLLLGAAWFVPHGVFLPLLLVTGTWPLLLPFLAKPVADRHWPADRRALALGCLFVVAGVAALLLLVQQPLPRLLASPLWVLASLLLYRGLGRGSGSVVVRLLAAVTLAAALLWLDLLLSLRSIPVQSGPYAHLGPIDVFAGWPFPGYVGSVRGGMRSEAPWLATAVWRNYLVMLGLAALVLAVPRWRSPTFLATWLPRWCCAIAVAQLFGGMRLVLAIDG